MKLAIVNLFRRNKTAFDVEDELQFHVEMLERKYTQDGLCAADAKAAALRRFGNFERVKKQCVNIRKRRGLLQRALKMFLILIAVAGLLISVGSSDYKVARIGNVLIMIAVMGRLLLYVRGLNPTSKIRKA